MLVLTRQTGQKVLIGDSIRLVVVSIGDNQVRLAIDAPREVPIRREELLLRDWAHASRGLCGAVGEGQA